MPDIADEKSSVAAVYEDGAIAQSYLDKRMRFSWQRLLHRRQVDILQSVLDEHQPAKVLEVAPGPARLSTELRGITTATMVENSQEMVEIASARLKSRGLDSVWKVVNGDAFALEQSVPAGSFDLAYTFRFLRHFRDAERFRLYEQLRKALKPEGLLVFDVVGSVVFEQVERNNPVKPADEIPIYDVAYTHAGIVAELEAHGFAQVRLVPLLRHFSIQSWISYKFDDVAPALAGIATALLERFPSKDPLEWVAICRKN